MPRYALSLVGLRKKRGQRMAYREHLRSLQAISMTTSLMQ
ncbi:MAG: hypothetical protein ACI9NT_000775 [Bacteroidia bacterium]|jgi:hypothetical protein